MMKQLIIHLFERYVLCTLGKHRYVYDDNPHNNRPIATRNGVRYHMSMTCLICGKKRKGFTDTYAVTNEERNKIMDNYYGHQKNTINNIFIDI